MVNINFNPAYLYTARLTVLGSISTFSIVILGLSAHWISATEKDFDPPFYDPYAAFALAVSCLTLLTVPALIVLERVRNDVIVNKIIVEMAWLGTLAILWLASAGTTGRAYNNSWLTCGFNINVIVRGCKETQAIQAFSHLTWVFLASYLVALFVLSLISRNNGVEVWHYSVRDAKFACSNGSSTQHATYEDKLRQPAQEVPVLQQPYPVHEQSDFAPQFQRGTPSHAAIQQV